jgi:hypothetical protein
MTTAWYDAYATYSGRAEDPSLSEQQWDWGHSSRLPGGGRAARHRAALGAQGQSRTGNWRDSPVPNRGKTTANTMSTLGLIETIALVIGTQRRTPDLTDHSRSGGLSQLVGQLWVLRLADIPRRVSGGQPRTSREATSLQPLKTPATSHLGSAVRTART